jgi:hypothetical protein
MVGFFVSQREHGPLSQCFATWAQALRPRSWVISYEELQLVRSVPWAQSYVFTDLERLTPAGRRLGATVATVLEQAPHSPRILNDPRRALGRYELLSALSEQALNPYRVHRAVALPRDVRFPVFVRDAHAHEIISPLLPSSRALEAALLRARFRGHQADALLVAEFHDTRDSAGVFHLHKDYLVGDRFIPGIIGSSERWEVRGDGGAVSSHSVARGSAPAPSRDHEPYLRSVAALARVSYGRFDYTVDRGRVCLWELNTSPRYTLLSRARYSAATVAKRAHIANGLTAGLAELADADGPPGPPIPLNDIDHGSRPIARVPWRQRTRGRLLLGPLEPLLLRALPPSRRRPLSAR